ncbi:MAG: hypothetical protein JXA67_06985 [Micromonosporaceae bacterium]|nr:hypothetical protein [Micromonosporaceae bacterium]
MLSPDRCIRALVSNYLDVEVSFRPGALARYREEDLSHQLARLGVLTWVGYHRGRSEAYRRSRGLSAEELAAAERPSADPQRVAYDKALNAIEGRGVSSGDAIGIRTVGMMQWWVDVRPGSIRQLGEKTFLAEIHSAITSLLHDREMKIVVLKAEHFDLGIPKKWLKLMRELQAANARRDG